jgi:hypothetical protein
MTWHELVLAVLVQPVFIINLSYKYPSKKDLSKVVDASKACMYMYPNMQSKKRRFSVRVVSQCQYSTTPVFLVQQNCVPESA